jgi:hypothetical protein
VIQGVLSTHDPYRIQDDWPNPAGSTHDPYRTTTGKTASPATIDTAERTAIMLAVGQSLISNENDVTLHTPTNAAKVDNLDPYTGAMWRGKDPWLGCAGVSGSWLGKFADTCINSGMFARVIICPIGIGGRPPVEWNLSGRYNHRLLIGLKRMRNLIGPTVGANTFPMVFWMMQGATAEAPIDGHITTYANYVADFGQAFGLMAGLGLGSDWPWYVSKTTYVAGVTKADIRQAQTDVVNGTTVRAGPDTDAVTARVDGVHFTATGCTTVANLWHTAIDPYY